MSCGNVKNPTGFAPCRVAKSKTRRVSSYVVWRSPKPAGFRAMSCGKVQNPLGFALCRVAKSKTRRVSRHVVCGNMKPAGFCTYPCRGVLHTPRNVLRQGFGSKIGRVLGISLLGWVKSGGFSAYPDGEMWNRAGFSCTRVGAYCIRPSNSLAEGLGVKLGVFFMYPCRGAKAYAPKCSSPKVWV